MPWADFHHKLLNPSHICLKTSKSFVGTSKICLHIRNLLKWSWTCKKIFRHWNKKRSKLFHLKPNKFIWINFFFGIIVESRQINILIKMRKCSVGILYNHRAYGKIRLLYNNNFTFISAFIPIPIWRAGNINSHLSPSLPLHK